MNRVDIKSKNTEELAAFIGSLGFPAYRAKQIYQWLHKGIRSFDEMTNLPLAMRCALQERCEIAWAEIRLKQCSQKDGTIKYLFRMNDGEQVESVLMKYHYGYSICISTQVGCKMNCSFCATGKSGFSRNLSPSEILSQVQAASVDIGERISHIVLMGMGEPLDNYENVLRFLELVTSPEGMNLGMRHISLSTCGIVDKIYRLADQKLQLTLSVSLHAPNDELRNKMMPVNRKWGLEELLRTCRYYGRQTGRRISFEYALISGVNDMDWCAKELARQLKGISAHVNLIPVNDVTGTGYRKSGLERQKKFVSILENFGVPATVRRTLGSDIEASCGQLKRRYDRQGGADDES